MREVAGFSHVGTAAAERHRAEFMVQPELGNPWLAGFFQLTDLVRVTRFTMAHGFGSR